MKNPKVLLALITRDNDYQREQASVAEATARRLGIGLQVVNADNGAIAQTRQILTTIQAAASDRPDAVIVEPVGTGMLGVATAAAGGFTARRDRVARILGVAAFTILAACHSASPPAAIAPATEEDPELVHSRIAGILNLESLMTGRVIPAGDTFVTWSPKPVLYTTVSRTDSTIASSLVTSSGVVGTAEAVWRGSVQRAVKIRWTQGRAILMEWNARFEGGVIHLAGARDTAFRAPSLPWAAANYRTEDRLPPSAGVRDTTLRAPALPWAVADYGMEDQLLPLIQAVCVRTQRARLAIYRPYPATWVTIAIKCRTTRGATLVTETEPDGEHFFWTITADGALVRLTRDRDPSFERRPLEMTGRVADYWSLRELWGR